MDDKHAEVLRRFSDRTKAKEKKEKTLTNPQRVARAWNLIARVSQGQARFINDTDAEAFATWLEQVHAAIEPLSTEILNEKAIEFAENIELVSQYDRGKGKRRKARF